MSQASYVSSTRDVQLYSQLVFSISHLRLMPSVITHMHACTKLQSHASEHVHTHARTYTTHTYTDRHAHTHTHSTQKVRDQSLPLQVLFFRSRKLCCTYYNSDLSTVPIRFTHVFSHPLILFRNLAELLDNFVRDFKKHCSFSPSETGEPSLTSSIVLPSSADLFMFYKKCLVQCISLSTGEALLSLTTLFQKYLEDYSERVLTANIPKYVCTYV